MNDEKMKVRFLTRVNSGGAPEPAGRVFTLPKEKAQEYIRRALAVEVVAETKPEPEPADKKVVKKTGG